MSTSSRPTFLRAALSTRKVRRKASSARPANSFGASRAAATLIFGADAGGGKRANRRLAPLAGGMHRGLTHNRRRTPCKFFRAKGGDPPVHAMAGVIEIMAGEPLHHCARQEVAFRIFRA